MWLDQALLAAIDDDSAGQLDGLVVCMPPQHGKSELCSKYLPAWYLGTFPDRRVLLTAYEADFASQWGRKARDLLVDWGHVFGVRVSLKSSAMNRWDLEGRDGGMSTAGVAGPITGKGAHLLIVDDDLAAFLGHFRSHTSHYFGTSHRCDNSCPGVPGLRASLCFSIWHFVTEDVKCPLNRAIESGDYIRGKRQTFPVSII